ncbi:CAAD domain-containing protein [Oscillatoria sp. FACHB-1407]|uniref:CAAD domain-containing protein n=1 Tax=Oscillatoria sp. FACHB-1407 TaxID=2692847 RepID=UPI001683EAB8|nr:CAAD domain-containing protein [Oscillatoria sp. FACHB-1407]MBD2464013.1 CAAD domain-containing protein [Oscillatoria sp. FACHB-1407]
MDPEVKQDPTSPEFVADELSVDLTTDDGTLTPVPVTRSDNEQWREFGEKASLFLAELPDYLSSFFGEYKRPIVVVGLVLGSIIAVKLTLAILDSVNDIPLLAPTFELIGLFYSGWFIYRYLLRASNRKELADDFNTLKEQILGNRASND